MQFKYRWWGKGDLDASIGIFFDGFSKILSATGIMLLVFGHAGGHRAGEDRPRGGAGHLRREPVVFLRGLGPGPPGRDRPALRHRRLPADGLAVPDHGPCLLADRRRGAGLPGGAGRLPHRRHDRGAGRLYRPVDREGWCPTAPSWATWPPRRWCGCPLWASPWCSTSPSTPCCPSAWSSSTIWARRTGASKSSPPGSSPWCWERSSPGAAGTSPGTTSPPPSRTWDFTRPPSAAGTSSRASGGSSPSCR